MRLTCRAAALTALAILAFLGCSSPANPAFDDQDDSAFNMSQTISDGAQRTTLAFSALAMMTGSLAAQSFYPPGKVADCTGFQYLRDNDPDGMGHNTSFLTRVACDVIDILDADQLAKLGALATAQKADFEDYGWRRYPLMQAFRMLMDGELPAGTSALSLAAVMEASRELYLIDGQISYDRAVTYAEVISSLTEAQKASLDAMVGLGWSSWPDRDTDTATARAKMEVLRQGTYFGSFYMKDAPAIGHEGYGIHTELSTTAGKALSEAAEGYVTEDHATLMSSLVGIQRANLHAGSVSIVSVRTEISTLLRKLLTQDDSDGSILTEVLSLSGTCGELDGDNNYDYATVFAEVYQSMSDGQKAGLMALRSEIMAGTDADGTPFDFTACETPFLYSSVKTEAEVTAGLENRALDAASPFE